MQHWQTEKKKKIKGEICALFIEYKLELWRPKAPVGSFCSKSLLRGDTA